MFRILPFYSVASAIVVLIMVTLLTLTYRQFAVDEMVRSAETQNVAYARILANHLWPRVVPLVNQLKGKEPDWIRSQPMVLELESAVIDLTKGLPILKIKIYGVDGITLFSSGDDVIGEDKSGNPDFRTTIRRGAPVTNLTHRDQFSAISGKLLNREVVESYIPVMGSGDTPEAVFELYSDVTALTARIRETTIYIVGVAVITFVALYGVLFLIVWHADKILKDQYKTLQDSEQTLKETLAELRVAEEQIRHSANHDALTGLPSLRLCRDRLSTALMSARRENSYMAIFFVDLDGFKSVNDSYGHDAGDYLLKEIAKRLLGCVRETDTVARIGGDEFMIIFPKVSHVTVVEKMADAVVQSVRQPVPWADSVLSVGASVGIALYPVHGEDAETLIKEADDAMYVAKRMGKNQYAVAVRSEQDSPGESTFLPA